MLRFQNTFSPTSNTRILDIGGTLYNWTILRNDAQIVLLNLTLRKKLAEFPENISFVQGDGTDLKYPDRAFDVAHSNSVIEHLGTFENQVKFAREIRRVGQKVWVQTPARSFFVEPHLLTPFIHYFPKSWQKHLLRNVTIWGWLKRPNEQQVSDFLTAIRLLSFAEMKGLFPDCEIHKERFLGFTKAYVAVRE